MQIDSETIYNSISEVVRDVQGDDVLPVGALGKIYSALDALRASRVEMAQISVAEQISVTMNRLELSRRRQDEETEKGFREQLKTLSAEWAGLKTLRENDREDGIEQPEHSELVTIN